MTGLRPAARRRAVRAPMALAAFSLLAVGACDIPTGLPQLDQRWILPAPRASITVADLLPADNSITILSDSSGFRFTPAAAAPVTRALSQDCGCSAANGTTVPKPAFVATASASTSLPADIVSATLSSGSITFALRNNYNFDPLRPASGVNGFAVVEIRNGTAVLARDSLNGATTSLPAGATLTRVIPVTGTVTGTSPVTITVTLNSPQGDPVLLDVSRTIVATVTPGVFTVASAQLAVVNRLVNVSSTVDLRNVDSVMIDAVEGGALLLTVTNPFNVSGPLTVTAKTAEGLTITRPVQLVAGTSSPSISFSKAEMQSLLGHNVTFTFTGTVNGSGPVSVTPKQKVLVTTRFDITLHFGG